MILKTSQQANVGGEFNEFTQQGLLHMDSLHVIENLILLCPGCHGNFDERVPIWAFLPVDLGAFITREAAFQERRRSFAPAGQRLQLPDPCKGKTPNLSYRRYQIRLGHLLPDVFAQRVQSWHGNPIAAILRSQSIVSCIRHLDPETQCSLPDEVALQLQKLLFLYNAPGPQLVAQEQIGTIRGTRNPLADHEDSSAPDSPCSATGQSPQSQLKRKQGGPRDGRSTHTGHHHKRQQHQQQHMQQAITTPPASNKRPGRTKNRCPRKSKRACTEPKWLSGPRMTANRNVEWHLDTSSNMDQQG